PHTGRGPQHACWGGAPPPGGTRLGAGDRVDRCGVPSTNTVSLFSVVPSPALTRHWLRRREGEAIRPFRLFVAIFGLIVTSTILAVTVINKFTEGAWMTVVITGCIILAGVLIRRHYNACNRLLSQADALFATT